MYYAYLLIEQKSYGIVNTWEECELKVSGVNAKYRKFKDHAAMLAWVSTEIKNQGGHINKPEVNPQNPTFGDTPGIIICDKKGERHIPISQIIEEENMYYAYLLLNQHIGNVVDSWKECKEKVNRVNSIHKSFKTEQKAWDWVVENVKALGGRIDIPAIEPEVNPTFGDTPGVICCDKDGESYIPVLKILKEEGYE